MNTYQLKCAIVSDVDLQRSVLGVFSSDELPQVHLLPGMGVIANTDIAGLPGRHWSVFDEMKSAIPNIEFFQGFPHMDVLSEWGTLQGHKVLVLDDLMVESADSKELVHLLTVGIHHNSITLIQILHNLYCKGKAMRTASLNCHYFVLFRNYRDQLQIQTLGRQIFPGQSKYFLDAYKKATSVAYRPLIIDLNPHTDKTYQLTTDRGVGQTPIVYHSAE
ncbi:Hypothetical predicted protein [Mytilus galloprovincialis]|uniref:Uncharacterized protein n=1 Tax=Mytilus galloprovincialis TaxID=29158 RepID=A0A8B6HC68_MYTGA|nr:Hypothetical predicted protein [Mytilus galloprovincialis]